MTLRRMGGRVDTATPASCDVRGSRMRESRIPRRIKRKPEHPEGRASRTHLHSRQPMRITEIFYSIQGESTHAGRPCIFVRLTGCNLRCKWCDTEYAFFDGHRMPIAEVAETLLGYRCDLIEVTGGEPLLQEGVYPL